MLSSMFPNCCGINILSDLGYVPTGDARAAREKSFLVQVSGQIKEAALRHRGLLLAVSQKQNGPMYNLLIKKGFKRLEAFSNPNSGNKVILMGYNLVEKGKAKPRRAVANA